MRNFQSWELPSITHSVIRQAEILFFLPLPLPSQSTGPRARGSVRLLVRLYSYLVENPSVSAKLPRFGPGAFATSPRKNVQTGPLRKSIGKAGEYRARGTRCSPSPAFTRIVIKDPSGSGLVALWPRGLEASRPHSLKLALDYPRERGTPARAIGVLSQHARQQSGQPKNRDHQQRQTGEEGTFPPLRFPEQSPDPGQKAKQANAGTSSTEPKNRLPQPVGVPGNIPRCNKDTCGHSKRETHHHPCFHPTPTIGADAASLLNTSSNLVTSAFCSTVR